MNTHVIDFLPSGEVEALHNDGFSLSFLGKQSIRRATEIAFDPEAQAWAIALPDPLSAFDGYIVVEGGEGFATYEDARRVEVFWLNRCRVLGITPDSPDGLVILAEIRNFFDS